MHHKVTKFYVLILSVLSILFVAFRYVPYARCSVIGRQETLNRTATKHTHTAFTPTVPPPNLVRINGMKTKVIPTISCARMARNGNQLHTHRHTAHTRTHSHTVRAAFPVRLPPPPQSMPHWHWRVHAIRNSRLDLFACGVQFACIFDEVHLCCSPYTYACGRNW